MVADRREDERLANVTHHEKIIFKTLKLIFFFFYYFISEFVE